MIGRKLAVSLSLLSTLAFCAFAAQTASATQTVWACEPGSAKEGFVDAHCVNGTKVEAEVKYVHKTITAGTETKVTFNNKETTNNTLQSSWWVFNTTIAGVAVEFACSEVSGSGGLTNKAGGGVSGNLSFEWKECTTTKPRGETGTTLCKVKEPIKISKASVKDYEGGIKQMGLELTPAEGKPMTEITLEDAVAGSKACALAGTYKVEGLIKSQYAGQTGSSSTLLIESGAEKELTIGGNTLSVYGSVTVKMEGTSTGVALTTGA